MKQLREVIFSKTDKRCKTNESFLQRIIDNSEIIFDSHGDPYYDENGNILMISPESFFHLAINNIQTKK